jgi:dihydrofolate reductase
MGKLVVGTFVTLDGVMQAPGGPDEDRDGGFEHGGWTVPFFDEELGEQMVELIGRTDAILLGRKTYDVFIQHWPHVGDEDPIAAKLNSAPKYVVSRTLDSRTGRTRRCSEASSGTRFLC